jgi:hypothetical protein
VGGDQLRGHHAFEFVLRTDPDQRGDGGAVLTILCLLVGLSKPERLKCLIGQNVVPIVRLRPAATNFSMPLRSSGSLAMTVVAFLLPTIGFLVILTPQSHHFRLLLAYRGSPAGPALHLPLARRRPSATPMAAASQKDDPSRPEAIRLAELGLANDPPTGKAKLAGLPS